VLAHTLCNSGARGIRIIPQYLLSNDNRFRLRQCLLDQVLGFYAAMMDGRALKVQNYFSGKWEGYALDAT